MAAITPHFPTNHPTLTDDQRDAFFDLVTLLLEGSNLNGLRRIIQRIGSVNGEDETGKTIVAIAAQCHNLPALERLANVGADFNHVNRWGATVFHDALSIPRVINIDCLNFLLDRMSGETLLQKNFQGKTVLDVLLSTVLHCLDTSNDQGLSDLVRRLPLDALPIPSWETREGMANHYPNTSLRLEEMVTIAISRYCFALSSGSQPEVDALEARNICCRTRLSDGQTVLASAIAQRQLAVIPLLQMQERRFVDEAIAKERLDQEGRNRFSSMMMQTLARSDWVLPDEQISAALPGLFQVFNPNMPPREIREEFASRYPISAGRYQDLVEEHTTNLIEDFTLEPSED